jgi:hypothetical protein
MPKGFYDEELVSQLAGNMWETWRIQAAKNDHLHDTLATVKKNFKHIRDKAKLNLEATKAELVAGGTADRACARLADLARKRDNIERALTRTGKRPATSGPSQMSLIINGRQHPGIPESYKFSSAERREKGDGPKRWAPVMKTFDERNRTMRPGYGDCFCDAVRRYASLD